MSSSVAAAAATSPLPPNPACMVEPFSLPPSFFSPPSLSLPPVALSSPCHLLPQRHASLVLLRDRDRCYSLLTPLVHPLPTPPLPSIRWGAAGAAATVYHLFFFFFFC